VPTMKEATTDFGVQTEVISDSVRVIAVAGELDIASVTALREALEQATEQETAGLVVDLARVTFVDSIGVGTILRAKGKLDARGRVAIVIPSQSYAAMIFDVVGADAIVDIFRTRAEALAHVDA
jgi:anti-sigma B factor antagonist